jgi:3-hydroxyisobutyrate dehydrogenase-like beta-hydroxyacid dehydrogenase
MSRRWGLIGFGEAGRVIAGAVTRSGADLVVHDVALRDPVRGEALAAAVAGMGARPAVGVEELADCDVVLSLVTPATAVDAAAAFAPAARDGVLYVDLNSAAPTHKKSVASRLPGARVVDGVMTGGGIQLDAERIPISLAGPDAQEAAGLLREVGLNAAVVGEQVGAAAGLKMLRSVVIKGLEGLWVEALMAADRLDVVEPLLATVEETLDRWPTRDFASMLVTTHVAHAGRRQVEARMSRETVEAAGVEPILSSAVAARHERTARGLAATGRKPGDVPSSLAEALAALWSFPDEHPAD